MIIRRYTPDDAAMWDTFCRDCWQATFLHSRAFLSYHQSRFTDQSLIITDDNKRWLGVFPAAIDPRDVTQVVSHPGITYGGIIHQGKLQGQQMLEALEMICQLYKQQGFLTLLYKVVPAIYHRFPAQDDLYGLFCLQAERVRTDLSSAIDLNSRFPKSKRRARSLKKAEKSAITIQSGQGFIKELWPVLVENLQTKHQTTPVHTFDEIMLLTDLFPDNIACITGYMDGTIVAGVILFDTTTVSHAQYIASSPQGYACCALDLIFEAAMDRAQLNKKRWLDFGISNENDGQILNHGLYQFKSEFGGGGVTHEFYKVTL